MKTEEEGPPSPSSTSSPPEALIPEARQHQRRRYRRRGAAAVIAGLVIAALIASGFLLFRSPGASGGTRPDAAPTAAVVAASSPVYFRPVLCFAAAYAGPAGVGPAPTSTAPVPPCAPSSVVSAANLHVTPQTGPQGYSSQNIVPDQQLASTPSTSPDAPGYATRTVLLPGLRGACDGILHVRCVLGPAEMSNRLVAKATVARTRYGQWWVEYSMTSAGAALWDKVAQENFHQFIAIETGGLAYSVPIMQPTQSTFSSFDGKGIISGRLTHADAVRLANALNDHRR